MLRSVFEWFDLTRSIAIAGFFTSILSLYFTWLNRQLSLAQEKRRLPRLIASLVHGYFQNRPDTSGRVYAFRVTISNPTDNNNAIAEAELSITYLTVDRTQMTMKIRANETLAQSFVRDQEQTLTVPVTIAAHSAVSGWLRFHLPAPMLADRVLESHHLVLTDPHGEITSVSPILVQEYRDET
jgi:hypothetical protein